VQLDVLAAGGQDGVGPDLHGALRLTRPARRRLD
jgi:hypothetical protein